MHEETKSQKEGTVDLAAMTCAPVMDRLLEAKLSENQRTVILLLAMGATQQRAADAIGKDRSYAGHIALRNADLLADLKKLRKQIFVQFMETNVAQMALIGFRALPHLIKRADQMTFNEFKAYSSGLKDWMQVLNAVREADEGNAKHNPVSRATVERTAKAIEALEASMCTQKDEADGQ